MGDFLLLSLRHDEVRFAQVLRNAQIIALYSTRIEVVISLATASATKLYQWLKTITELYI